MIVPDLIVTIVCQPSCRMSMLCMLQGVQRRSGSSCRPTATRHTAGIAAASDVLDAGAATHADAARRIPLQQPPPKV